MSNKAEKILALASNFEKKATDALVSEAKKKDNKKLDPKAKVRNRGTVCVPAEQAKDKKDHFPINDADQARNALARVHQYSSVPDWYKGSLSGLQALVARKVKAKYPKIDVGGKKEKKSFSLVDELVSFAKDIEKYGQASETMTNNLELISASLIDSATKLKELKNNPGDVPPGNIDAAEMQITNARNQLAQAQREAAKGPNAQQLDYYLSDIKKYYGYAQSYVKRTDIWDSGLNQIIDTAVSEAKNPPQPQSGQQQQTPTAKPTAKPKGDGWTGPRIDPVFQTMLGVNPDTKLGRQTQAALDVYKKTIGQTGASNELAFEALKREPQYASKTAIPYDDNANVYQVTREKKIEQLPPNTYEAQKTWGG